MSMPMFVCLAGYLNVLAFLPKLTNVDFNAGMFFYETQKKSKCPIIFKFVFITYVVHQRVLVFAVFRPTLDQSTLKQHNWKCRLSKIYHPEILVPSFILVFSSKLGFQSLNRILILEI